jgi:hypothetical protein
VPPTTTDTTNISCPHVTRIFSTLLGDVGWRLPRLGAQTPAAITCVGPSGARVSLDGCGYYLTWEFDLGFWQSNAFAVTSSAPSGATSSLRRSLRFWTRPTLRCDGTSTVDPIQYLSTHTCRGYVNPSERTSAGRSLLAAEGCTAARVRHCSVMESALGTFTDLGHVDMTATNQKSIVRRPCDVRQECNKIAVFRLTAGTPQVWPALGCGSHFYKNRNSFVLQRGLSNPPKWGPGLRRALVHVPSRGQRWSHFRRADPFHLSHA